MKPPALSMLGHSSCSVYLDSVRIPGVNKHGETFLWRVGETYRQSAVSIFLAGKRILAVRLAARTRKNKRIILGNEIIIRGIEIIIRGNEIIIRGNEIVFSRERNSISRERNSNSHYFFFSQCPFRASVCSISWDIRIWQSWKLYPVIYRYAIFSIFVGQCIRLKLWDICRWKYKGCSFTIV